MLTNDNLLVHLHVKLSLWWNLVEASATSVALHIYYAQTVTSVLAYALEALQQSALNLQFDVLCLSLENILLLACLLHYLIQFATLVLQVVLALVNLLLHALAVSLTVIDALLALAYLLLAL